MGLFLCSTTVDHRAFAALSMDSETIVVDFMPIHITHRDKKSSSTQHADVSWVIREKGVNSLQLTKLIMNKK